MTFQLDLFNNEKLLYDAEDSKIILLPLGKKTKWKIDKNDLLYVVNSNMKKIYLLNLLFDKRIIGYYNYNFINGNKYDYRRENINITDIFIPQGKIIGNKINGIIPKNGPLANVELNFAYEINDKSENYILMHVKGNSWTKIDKDIFENIKKFNDQELIWMLDENNLVTTKYKLNNMSYLLHLNKYIYQKKNGDLMEVPKLKYKNCDSLDNRYSNIIDFHDVIETELVNYENDIIINHNEYLKDYKTLESYEGHWVLRGQQANKIFNPYWKVIEKNTDKTFYIMHCHPNNYMKFDIEDFPIINKTGNRYNTWYLGKNGYIVHSNNGIITYAHRLIMLNLEPNDDPKLSVDHINRDKLDNRRENLRWASQSLQNSNTDKRARKHNAQELPKELENIQLPKYVYYSKEIYNKETGATREFFRIEKHPKLESKCWSSSKSNKISILDKLEETKKKLYELDNDVQEEVSEEFVLPIGVRINENKARNNRELVLDWRTEKLRYNLKMVYNENISLKDNFDIFKEKIKKKYPELEKQQKQQDRI